MRLLFIVLHIIIGFTCFGQDISGHWEGKLIQNPGREFVFEMDITYSNKDSVKGTTTIKDPNSSNYGKLSFIGQFKDSVLSFQEIEILKEDKSKKDEYWNSLTFYWCIKSGELNLSSDGRLTSLQGNWKSTGSCQPGTINVQHKIEEVEDCAKAKSADFMFGLWSGKFTQYSCGINGTYDMILMIDEVDGMEFSGFFIWPASDFMGDSKSRLKGVVKGGKIYIYETKQISGDPLLIGGTYHSTLDGCHKMSGYWNMPKVPLGCTTPEVTKNGGRYKLDHYVIPTIYFDHEKSELTKQSRKDLDEFAQFLKKFRNLNISLSGFTDNTGSNAFNLLLSQERAEIVKQYLVDKGIQESRIKTARYGSMLPAEDNKTEAGRVLNRRTEISIRK